MSHSKSAYVRTALVAISLALAAASPALAQGRGGGGPPPGGGGPGGGMGGPPGGPMGGPGGGMGNPPFPNGGNPPMGRGPGGNEPSQSGRSQATDGVPHPGLQLGPPGRWWDDKSMAKNLKLRPDQQARMDAIFDQNRAALSARLTNAQQADAQMLELAKSPSPDEAALFAQIDRVYQARADLDKAETHYLLQIRKEMDPDQIKRLEKAMQR